MIRIDGITKSYGTREFPQPVLKGISTEIADSEFVVLLGPSGSGKSTLLHIVAGLDTPDSGSVWYGDTDIAALSEKQRTDFRRRHIGFVFQQYDLLPHMTVEQNVRMGADLVQNAQYSSVISAVGLGEKRHAYPGELSGGEMQRVAIARALAKVPEILFLDEPTGALDEATGRQVLALLQQLQREQGCTMMMVTHNGHIADMANTVLHINSGKIVSCEKNPSPKSADEIGW